MPVEPAKTDHYHVFLASPGDMNREREEVRRFFRRYNHATARHRGLQFDVIDWENHSSLGVGETQALISRDTLLRHRKSLALVIGLLGQRFGTPTEKAESGTEEEFLTALEIREENGDFPEIKWFFRKQWPTEGATADPVELAKAIPQIEKVNAFKRRLCKGENKLLYAEFDKSEDFPDLLSRDLEPWLNDERRPWNAHRDEPVSASPATRAVDPKAGQWLDAYYKALLTECENLPLEKLGEGNVTIHLSQVHIPLRIKRPPPHPESDDPDALKRHALRLERGGGDDDDEMPVLEMLAEQRLAVLVGGPGSGKSALVNWVTSRLLGLGEEAEKDALPPRLCDLKPVRLVLRRAPDVDQAENRDWIWQALEADITDKLKPQGQQDAPARAKAAAALLRARTEGDSGLLFLLDGLDEVGAAAEQRERLIRAVRDFIDTLPQHCRLLLTARPYAYTDEAWRLPKVPDYVLAPMDRELRAAFIHRWHAVGRQQKGWTEDEAAERAEKLIQTVETSPHLQDLAQRPLQATLISLLSLRGRLPRDRAELYENAVELLIDRWRSGESAFRGPDNQIIDIPERKLREALERLAWEVHRDQRGEANREDAADISPDRLSTVLAPVLSQERVCFDDLLVWLRDHTGILAARDEHHFAFPHRAFQEHLAMCWLAGQSTEAPVAGQAGEDPLWWREVFLLAVANERKTPRNGVQHVTELLDLSMDDPDRRARAGVLAGLGLLELELNHLRDEGDFQPARSAARDRLAVVLETPGLLPIEERAEAGRVLGHLGDPRRGVGCFREDKSGLMLPGFDWVKIPGGPFDYGDERTGIEIEDFYIARYPVTHAQFQAFLDDPEGYGNPAWWKGLDAGPEKTLEASWPIPNHPRETVSWFHAMAFCAWASDRLGYAIRLPKEQEWERTAGGTEGREYPWGDEYLTGCANVREYRKKDSIYLQRTTAVGIYPSGRSPEGVFDLAGNVWEWCLNEYHQPKNTEPGGKDPRVLRGGAWGLSPDFAGARFRDGGSPEVRYDGVGFRVLSSSPILRAGR